MRPHHIGTLALFGLVSCSSGRISQDTPSTGIELDDSDRVYDASHLMQVDIVMDGDDWDRLRHETRTLADTLAAETCGDEPFESPFEWYEAAVTVDGEVFGRVEVRKKGFLGSMNEDKPSLKIDLGEFDDTASLHGVRRLTLNNAVSDPSLLRQCLAYAAFADAGVPSSRCSMASVRVNGEDKGVFVNIEPVKEPFLLRHFGDDSGNLYEGTLSDFREGWTGTFDKKTNEDAAYSSDIDAVVEALEADDDELLDAIDAVVDLDAFLTFWAMEVLTLHVDGYAWNTNNYYVYADPADGRFHFIPWGVDAAFYPYEAGQQGPPDTVYAFGRLAHRLYAHPEGRERYLERLDTLLAGSWDEQAHADRIDRLRDTIEPALGAEDSDAVHDAIDVLEDLLAHRRGNVLLERAGGAQPWEYGEKNSFCLESHGSLSATFETTWGSVNEEDAFSYGESLIDVVYDGEAWPALDGAAVAGPADDGLAVLYLPVWTSDTEAWLTYAVFPEELAVPGEIELDLGNATGALYYYNAEWGDEWQVASYLLGTLTLEEAGPEHGDVLIGGVDGELVGW
jgi:spore coat protein CotH